ncbi:protein FAM234B isoform X2 [Lycorma delicatula]|uniref:protein FAM234B isoform X2 n=1 Tax=Lycorma delicatula TaxID=130591 RepID=UPI003F50F914
MGDYQPLRSDGEQDGTAMHRRTNVSSAKQDLYYKKPWSPLRKMAFVTSLILCFMTISVFLWVIPCEWSTCPSNIKQLGWDKTLYGLEMKGEMSVVKTRFGMYLIVMARGAIWNSSSSVRGQQFPPHGSAVICLSGSSGDVSWWIKLSSNPIELDCSILDVNNDGINDCLVLGEHGYLVSIDPESGIKKWKFWENLGLSIVLEKMTFPLVIPDVNNDGINDLIAIAQIHGTLHDVVYNEGHYLVLICGKTGHLLGRPINNQSCSNMYGLGLDDDSSVLSYTCKTGNSYSKELSQSLTDIVSEATKKVFTPVQKTKLKQHVSSGLSNEYSVGKHRLSLSRTGHCPEMCSVSLNITFCNDIGQKEPTNFAWQEDYIYIMNPVLINFDHTLTGFVLKFWQWPHHSIPDTPGKINKTKIKLEKISERVILVTFNETGEYNDIVKIVNASQTDIMQICSSEGCQPELNLQTDSKMKNEK